MPTQVVQVNVGGQRTYAYRWHGRHENPPKPLSIGDRVLLPANAVTPEPFWGIVESFGAQGYDGPMAEVIERG